MAKNGRKSSVIFCVLNACRLQSKLLWLLGAARQGCSSSAMGKPFFKHRFSLIKLPKIKLYDVLSVTYYSISRREPPFIAFGFKFKFFFKSTNPGIEFVKVWCDSIMAAIWYKLEDNSTGYHFKQQL